MKELKGGLTNLADELESQTDRQTDRKAHRHMQRQTDKWTYVTDEKTVIETDRRTSRLKGK